MAKNSEGGTIGGKRREVAAGGASLLGSGGRRTPASGVQGIAPGDNQKDQLMTTVFDLISEHALISGHPPFFIFFPNFYFIFNFYFYLNIYNYFK